MPDIDQSLRQPANLPGKIAFIGMRRKTALRPSIEIPDLVCPPVIPAPPVIGAATGKKVAIESSFSIGSTSTSSIDTSFTTMVA